MNVQLSTVSDSRKNLVVTLDKEEVDTEHKAVVGEYVRQARLPGFRPGKAPAAMVIKRFSKEIAEEFKQKVVSKAYRGALEKEKLDVLSVVSVEEGKIESGLSAAITVTVDVQAGILASGLRRAADTDRRRSTRLKPRLTASSRRSARKGRISSRPSAPP